MMISDTYRDSDETLKKLLQRRFKHQYQSNRIDPSDFKKTHFKAVTTVCTRQGGVLGFDKEIPTLTIADRKQLFEEQQKYQQLLGRNQNNLKSNTVEEKGREFIEFVEAQKSKKSIDFSELSRDALTRCNVIRKKSINVLNTRGRLFKAYNIPEKF